MNLKQLLLASLLVLLPGCWQNSDDQKLLVVNVLEPELYRDCHIPGSINVQLEDLESWARDISLEREIVFYCSNYFCTASQYAAELLQKLGFKHVYAYEAGMAAWRQQGLPVTGPAQQAYLRLVVSPPTEHTGGSTNSQSKNFPVRTISTAELAAKMGLKLSA